MTNYYVGPGGDDRNDGLSWSTRKLTLNGAEAIPPVPGDTVYVSPGTYRETLICLAKGDETNPIIYQGDVTGSKTDGLGGVVRITGSDDDRSIVRESCLSIPTFSRTFRGFTFDSTSKDLVEGVEDAHLITLEDCNFQQTDYTCIYIYGNLQGWTIRRCIFMLTKSSHIHIQAMAPMENANHIIENCLFISPNIYSIYLAFAGGSRITNCTFIGGPHHIYVAEGIGSGLGLATIVTNCVLTASLKEALWANDPGNYINEDYNTFYGNGTDRFNVTPSENSNTWLPNFTSPILAAGIQFPFTFAQPSFHTLLGGVDAKTQQKDDFYGILRPNTGLKQSRGAIQFANLERSTIQSHSGKSSLVLNDSGAFQMWVPVDGSTVTVSVWAMFEEGYLGQAVNVIIKQSAQEDLIMSNPEAKPGVWFQLSTKLRPASSPGYIVVELRSENEAAEGNHRVWFDTLEVL